MKHKYMARRYWNVKIPTLNKIDKLSKRYDDIINLSVGDIDYPCDRGIIEAMHQAGLEGHTKYTDFLGDEDLRKEICNKYNRQYNSEFAPNNVIISSGGTHAMYLVLESILDEGDEVIVISPYYMYYKQQIELAKGKLIVYNTLSENEFEINLKELEGLITPRTKAIIVNSPNNPTGKVYCKETINGIINLINKHDFLLIADDIYESFNYTDKVNPICSHDWDNPKIITVYSFSKDYSMTGFRLGYVIGEKSLIECMTNVNGVVSFTINAMTQRAGIYALQNRDRIQKGLYEEYRKRVFYTYERVNRINNMKCSLPEGTFYLFVDVSETGYSSEKVSEMILEEAHVLVLPGDDFGQSGKGHIRIACSASIAQLGQAFDRIGKMDIFK